jgi:hypothetical protein
MLTNDTLTRNPTHYAALSKYTKYVLLYFSVHRSHKTCKYLLLYSLKLEGWEFFLTMFNEV